MSSWLHHSLPKFNFPSRAIACVFVFRTKLTSAAEKESIAMFVRNLRQRLLVCPVRGCVIMGVDPGFKHGCKLAILSPTSEWTHYEVLYQIIIMITEGRNWSLPVKIMYKLLDIKKKVQSQVLPCVSPKPKHSICYPIWQIKAILYNWDAMINIFFWCKRKYLIY